MKVLSTLVTGAIFSHGPSNRVRDDELGKFPGPAVSARTGFHANQARWQLDNEFDQLGTRHLGAYQHGFACFIHAMHGENVLCQIDANGYPHVMTKMRPTIASRGLQRSCGLRQPVKLNGWAPIRT